MRYFTAQYYTTSLIHDKFFAKGFHTNVYNVVGCNIGVWDESKPPTATALPFQLSFITFIIIALES